MAKRIIHGSNLAIALVNALGAYCPKVKIQDEASFYIQRARERRQKRPLTGRGNYGEGLRAHFANERMNEILAKQVSLLK